jgi:hypothetical protein
VADRKRVQKTVATLQRVKTWQLLILLILAGFVAATFLRLNSIGMIQRRDAVVTADEKGDEATTIRRLSELQQYVSGHMNTDMGKGVFLQTSYNNAVKAADNAAGSDSNPNGNIYKKAQDVCAPQFTRYSTAYLQCTISQLQKYPAASNLISTANLPNPSTYLHDFVSPVWSPDFAGWSVLLCIVLALMIVIRLVSLLVLRIVLRLRFKAI